MKRPKKTTPTTRSRPGQTVHAAPRTPARSQVRKLGRKPVPENESRHDRFVRLGTRRMNNAIRQIQLLGNLCGPNYECDADDLTSMRDAISHELEMALARFSPRKRLEATGGFKFGSTPTQH